MKTQDTAAPCVAVVKFDRNRDGNVLRGWVSQEFTLFLFGVAVGGIRENNLDNDGFLLATLSAAGRKE